ncbi:hypothetical protein BDW02DRAFT_421300 [Decorospora gaudefroyi]|uniref:Uncharacterized protein n=1 Tax=Decorospora gaudefroyi TaxID=184978 RepID=A0A6A5K4J3_9PLEO|nr:hypothetical protein BDW02DRAFT_421300 [Decorospora gaudefroyi]
MQVLGVCSLVGLMQATSRQMWSFVRDNALAFLAQIIKLHLGILMPVNTIVIMAILSLAGLYASYFIISSSLLARNSRGHCTAHELAFGGTVTFPIVWYFARGRKTHVALFRGRFVERGLGRDKFYSIGLGMALVIPTVHSYIQF